MKGVILTAIKSALIIPDSCDTIQITNEKLSSECADVKTLRMHTLIIAFVCMLEVATKI